MKLHLPFCLRRCLLATFTAALALTCVQTVKASVQHPHVSILTYTDFGQNRGRYATGNTNALLQHLNANGVAITYIGDHAAYMLPHGMIDYSSQADNGASAALGYNFITTVQHNGVQNPTFTGNDIGSGYSIRYQGIEARNGSNTLLTPQGDYKLTRLSKLITDVTGSTVYSGEAAPEGMQLYRAGAGTMYRAQEDGSYSWVYSPYGYITGGIDTIDSVSLTYPDGSLLAQTHFDASTSGITAEAPLPYMLMSGDSGSPAWVWNETTGQYEYYATCQGVGQQLKVSIHVSNCGWTTETMSSFDTTVSLGDSHSTIKLNAVDQQGELFTDTQGDNTISTTLYYGSVTDAQGTVLTTFNGVQSGLHTWKDLSSIKDSATWYTYGSEYLNAANTATSGKDLLYADLFNNNNLILSADSATTHTVQLTDTVDLGIGYVLFKPTEANGSANFIVESEQGESNLLNTAGFIVEAGTSVTFKLTNPAEYMREWRKVGDGTLTITGSGNNDILLNVGGNGTTRLEREEGYAAYNVLVNNGSRVIIHDIGQIKRDLTFGYRGGVLDMNGCSLTWNNGNAADAEGFTIHALDEQAIITNSGATTTTLTWKQEGAQTWLGSFTDTEQGALRFVYDGGETSSLTLHSIHTNLQHQDSEVEVQSGSVSLAGSATVHGTGSATGTNTSRYSHADDWHYADATMNVNVASGAIFELGSHARLTGDVTVAASGTYIMREGVTHRMEYIEGGYELEDTDAIAAFFGHKGDVVLEENATMQVAFSTEADSTLIYAGSISGAGSLSVDTQGGLLKLSGTNTFSGSKAITRGGLHATSTDALGDTRTNKWVIGSAAWLASDGFTDAAQILDHIDSGSTGVLALSKDVTGQIDLSSHSNLIIGAAEGCTVHYGSADATLNAVGNTWTLGGGGGTLIVDFKLTGENNLVLGNSSGTGNVHLSNNDNDFTGSITTTGGVTLSYDDSGALGDSTVTLGYGDRFLMQPGVLSHVTGNSTGALLLDSMGNTAADLNGHTGLALGASQDTTYTGTITLAEDAAYRFGGISGTLTVGSALQANHDLVIDGQGYSGTVIFTNAEGFNGAVTLMGYDTTLLSSGSATLSFAADNALNKATSFTIKAGGSIDLAGTSQTLAGVTLESGGSITDSSTERSGSVTFNGTGSLNGTLNAAHAIKTGEGVLELGGTNSYERFEVQGGTLKLTSATATSATGEIVINDGSSLNINYKELNGSITLYGGTITGNNSNQNAVFTVKGQGKLTDSLGTFSGLITIEKGASLTVSGDSSLTFKSLAGEGELSLSTTRSGNTLYAISGDNSAFCGNLSFTDTGAGAANNGKAIQFETYKSFGSGTVMIDGANFHFTNNTASTPVQATLVVGDHCAVLNGRSGTSYYFTNLSGQGTLYSCLGKNNTGIEGSANFCGDLRDFSGEIDSNNGNSATSFMFSFGGTDVDYHQMTGSDSASAADLFSSSNTTTLNSSTAKAQLNYQFQYADDVILNAKATGRANITQAGTGCLVLNQANDATGTLTINAGGTVQVVDGGTWVGALAGAGTLVNNNTQTAVSISSLANFSGSLDLARGSELSLGGNSTLSLASGQSLAVHGKAANAATLSVSVLNLSGGSLSFSGESLQTGNTPTLELGSTTLSFANNLAQTLSFTATSDLAAGTYLLASGDWSALDSDQINVSGLSSYFTSEVQTGAYGLQLTLALTEGTVCWDAHESDNTWSNTNFGSSATTPGADGTALFTDTATSRTVRVTEEVKAAALIFNTALGYTVGAEGNGKLEAATLQVEGGGTVTLGAGISISQATTIAEGSELSVLDFSTLSGSVSGAGMLSIDAAQNSGSLSASLNGLDTLSLLSGRYEAKADTGVHNIVVDGGQYFANGGTHTADITLGGTGWDSADDEHAGAALRAEGATLSGTVQLTQDATLAVTGATASSLTKVLNTGNHTLTVQGGGQLALNTSGVTGNITVSGKDTTLVLKKDIYSGLNTLSLADGATAELVNVDFSGATIHLGKEASLLFTHSTAYTNSIDATICVEGASTIGGSVSKGVELLSGSISGSECLSFKATGNAWTLKSTISDADNGSLALLFNTVVEIDNSNSYSGGTEIQGGSVALMNASALGSGRVLLSGGTLDLSNIASNSGESADGGDAADDAFAGDTIFSNDIIVTGTATLNGATAYNGQLTLDGGSLSGGSITLAQDALLTSGSITNVLSGMAGVVKTGEGEATLSGINTYTGETLVQGGCLILTGSVAGDISVSQSARLKADSLQLTTGSSLRLDTEATLEGSFSTAADITLSSDAGSSITGTLTLNGGNVEFDDISTGGLATGTLSLGSDTTTLDVGDITNLTTGDYTLVSFSGSAPEKLLDALSLKMWGNAGIRNTYELSLADNALQLSVANYSANLNWDKEQSIWKVGEEGDDWLTTNGQNQQFVNGDKVNFSEGGTITLVGTLLPASVTVNGDATTTFMGEGSIAGETSLTKTGTGTLIINNANRYSGSTSIEGGTVQAGDAAAFGNSVIHLSNGSTLDLGGCAVRNAIKVSGKATLKGATQLTDLTLYSGSETQTDDAGLVLGVGQTLTTMAMPQNTRSRARLSGGESLIITNENATLNGSLTLSGGTLFLQGTMLTVHGGTVIDGSSTTQVDLSAWSGITGESDIRLANFGNVTGTGNVTHLSLSGLDATLISTASLVLTDEGFLNLVFSEPGAEPTPRPNMAAALANNNQRSVYAALREIAADGSATGALATAANTAATSTDAGQLRDLLDEVGGADYATMMSSQMEGNLAHLRRLRAHMGRGHMLADSKSGLVAYANAFSELAEVDADASGPGYRRSEWGAEFGIEQEIAEGMGLGLAFSQGRAHVTPSSGTRYQEDSQNLDAYHVMSAGPWENRLSIGVGFHEHDLRRRLNDGSFGHARGVDGISFNFMEELAYNILLSESVTLRPFAAIESSFNKVDAFTESGLGTLSLHGEKQEAWSTDITLGMSGEMRFSLLANAPQAAFSAYAGVTASVGDTTDDLRLRFAGAPGHSFEQRSADRNRWGVNLGATFTLPVTRFTSLYATAETLLRGDSSSFDAQLGIRMNF